MIFSMKTRVVHNQKHPDLLDDRKLSFNHLAALVHCLRFLTAEPDEEGRKLYTD